MSNSTGQPSNTRHRKPPLPSASVVLTEDAGCGNGLRRSFGVKARWDLCGDEPDPGDQDKQEPDLG
jgi:hypothetical protein